MTAHPLLAGMESARRNWGWFLVLGIALVILGMMALGAPLIVTLASVMWFGAMLVASAFVEIVSAFRSMQWGGFFLHLAAGMLFGMIGLMLLGHPAEQSLTLTLILAVYFVVSGVFRVIAAIAGPFPNRAWIALSGLINVVLGVLIWRDWPSSGLWFIGMCVGIDLIFHGWSWVMFAFAAKRLPTVAAG